jgi:UrcA family protein
MPVKTLALCVFGLALAAPLAAQAAAPGDPAGDQSTAVRVRYDDLNLNNERDAGIMLTRLDRATLAACGAPEGSLREYRAAVRESACYQRGLRQAVAAVNAPPVTGLYRQSIGPLAAN